MTSTRELVDTLTAEARKIVEAAQEEDQVPTPVHWTGKSLVMAGSMRVWFLFVTPDTTEGQMWMRLTPGGYVMTRTPSEMEEA